jgi:hypothetical protein
MTSMRVNMGNIPSGEDHFPCYKRWFKLSLN